MAHGVNNKTGSSFLVVALAAILVLGGVMVACSRAPTSTSVTTRTTTSSLSTTTSAPVMTSTSVPSTTTSAPAPTATTVSAAASFYRANVVTVVVPYAAGGNVDYMARLFANYWNEFTGGRMVVVNKEGAGGITGTNYAYAAKPDGLTMGEGIMSSCLILPVLAQDPAVKFDLKKMNWIELYTSPGDAGGLAISPKLPYKSMQDLSKVEGLKIASTGRYDGPSLGAALAIELFGLKDARIVPGYGGAAEVQLAVAKGEADAYSMAGGSLRDGADKGLTKQSFLTLDFVRSTYFPDAPTVPELLKLSPEQENLLKTYAALRASYVFWYQPGVPQDRIEFVRNAFDKIVAMEDFLKQSLLRFPVYAKPVSGKDFAAEMEKSLAVVTPERFNELKALVDKYMR